MFGSPWRIQLNARRHISCVSFSNYTMSVWKLFVPLCSSHPRFGGEHVMWVHRLEGFWFLPGKKNSKVANRNCWAPTPDNPLLFRCSISPPNPIAGSYQFYLEKINNETTGPMTLFKQTLSLKPGEAFQWRQIGQYWIAHCGAVQCSLESYAVFSSCIAEWMRHLGLQLKFRDTSVLNRSTARADGSVQVSTWAK